MPRAIGTRVARPERTVLRPGGDVDIAVGCPDGGRPVRGAVDEQAIAEGHAPESEGLICHALTVARACEDPAHGRSLRQRGGGRAAGRPRRWPTACGPTTLDGFVGQAHLVGPGTALRRAIEEDRVPSAIFYGAAGHRQDDAGAASSPTHRQRRSRSCPRCRSGKADVTARDRRARERLGGHGRRTILFLDEIHRFNKAQQDALLPVVESGLITLIGATTENPYFEINSRAAVALRAVRVPAARRADDLSSSWSGAPADLHVTLGAGTARGDRRGAGGDAPRGARRRSSWRGRRRSRAASPSGREDVAEAAMERPVRYDRDGDVHYDVARRSSRACAAPTPTRPSTGWR